MNQLVQNYLEERFTNVPSSRGMIQLKKELAAEMQYKFEKLIQAGYSDKEALEELKIQMGDLDELINRMKKGLSQHVRWISYPTTTFVFLMIGFMTGRWDYAWIVFLLPCTLSSIMVIVEEIKMSQIRKKFNKEQAFIDIRSNRPKQMDIQDNDEFKMEKIGVLLDNIMFPEILIVYFLVSFTTNMWSVTWLIFLIPSLLKSLLRIILSKKY